MIACSTATVHKYIQKHISSRLPLTHPLVSPSNSFSTLVPYKLLLTYLLTQCHVHCVMDEIIILRCATRESIWKFDSIHALTYLAATFQVNLECLQKFFVAR